MIKIGDVCPLFFSPLRDKFAPEAEYTQKFHSSDRILIQLFSTGGETPSVFLNDLVQGTSTPVGMDSYQVNDDVTMYHACMSGLSDSFYTVTVNGNVSEPFEVCSSDEVLERTALVRYSHHDNNSAFDNIFWIGDEKQVFEFRVEAGFKPGGYSAKVDNEQYRTQHQEGKNLYSVPYDTYALTVGDACGVPYWFARHLNRLLCLSDVEIDGTKYIRSESSVPELSPVMEGGQLFYVSVLLERQQNDISGIGGRPEAGERVSVGFSIKNPQDGQLLQYQSAKSAFVNVTTVEV